MKKMIFLLLISFVTMQNTEAQLLKKLKDKAQKALEPKKPDPPVVENNGNAGNEGNASASKIEKKWVPTSNCNLVFTLDAGEQFFYDETEVVAKNNAMSYSFIVQNKKYEYFLIEDGVRTGPFKEAPSRKVDKPETEEESTSSNDDDKISMGGDSKDPVAIQYSKTINGKLYLVFNGKNYGPYDYISKMKLSPDKKHFFALVTIGGANAMTAKMGMGNCFIVSDGTLKQKVGNDGNTIPVKFSISNGFKQCMATIMDQSAQKVLKVSSTGKSEESSMTDLYTDNGLGSVVSDFGDIITIPAQSPRQILVNGEEAASFKVPIKSMSRLFLLPDIKKSVYYEKGKFYRADGTEESVTDILFPKLLILNNEAAIYYYKVVKNENAGKDVYLCKKTL